MLESDIAVDNTACVTAGDGEERCATAAPLRPVRELPRTGETPWWRTPLLLALLLTTLAGLGGGRLIWRRSR